MDSSRVSVETICFLLPTSTHNPCLAFHLVRISKLLDDPRYSDIHFFWFLNELCSVLPWPHFYEQPWQHMNTVQQAVCSHKAAQNFKGQAAGMFYPHRNKTVQHNAVRTQVMNHSHEKTLEIMPSPTGSGGYCKGKCSLATKLQEVDFLRECVAMH